MHGRLFRLFVMLAIVLAIVSAGCGDLKLPTEPPIDPGPPPDPSATFTRVQNEIFTPACAISGCHGVFAPQENLVLASGQAYGNIVNRPSAQLSSLNRVTPGDPENSYLYRKVTGSGITGDRMPQASPPLSEAHLRLIRDWIRRGAPND